MIDRFLEDAFRVLSCPFWSRVSCPMFTPVPKSVHFMDYLNFNFFLCSICSNMCNLPLVICLLRGPYRQVIRGSSFFFNVVLKSLWYREQRLKISGIYDENCARGTHLKFRRNAHNYVTAPW